MRITEEDSAWYRNNQQEILDVQEINRGTIISTDLYLIKVGLMGH